MFRLAPEFSQANAAKSAHQSPAQVLNLYLAAISLLVSPSWFHAKVLIARPFHVIVGGLDVGLDVAAAAGAGGAAAIPRTAIDTAKATAVLPRWSFIGRPLIHVG